MSSPIRRGNTAGHPDVARFQPYGLDADRAPIDPVDHVLPADEDRPALPDEPGPIAVGAVLASDPRGSWARAGLDAVLAAERAAMPADPVLSPDAYADEEERQKAARVEDFVRRIDEDQAEPEQVAPTLGQQLATIQAAVGELIVWVAAREPLGADVPAIVAARIRSLMAPDFSAVLDMIPIYIDDNGRLTCRRCDNDFAMVGRRNTLKTLVQAIVIHAEGEEARGPRPPGSGINT